MNYSIRGVRRPVYSRHAPAGDSLGDPQQRPCSILFPGNQKSLCLTGLRGLCTKSSNAGPWFDILTTNVGSNSPFALSLSKGNSPYATLLVQSRLRDRLRHARHCTIRTAVPFLQAISPTSLALKQLTVPLQYVTYVTRRRQPTGGEVAVHHMGNFLDVEAILGLSGIILWPGVPEATLSAISTRPGVGGRKKSPGLFIPHGAGGSRRGRF